MGQGVNHVQIRAMSHLECIVLVDLRVFLLSCPLMGVFILSANWSY